jgi:hypothetical protein
LCPRWQQNWQQNSAPWCRTFWDLLECRVAAPPKGVGQRPHSCGLPTLSCPILGRPP